MWWDIGSISHPFVFPTNIWSRLGLVLSSSPSSLSMLASLNTVGDQTRTHEELLALLKSSQNQTNSRKYCVKQAWENYWRFSCNCFYRKKSWRLFDLLHYYTNISNVLRMSQSVKFLALETRGLYIRQWKLTYTRPFLLIHFKNFLLEIDSSI